MDKNEFDLDRILKEYTPDEPPKTPAEDSDGLDVLLGGSQKKTPVPEDHSQAAEGLPDEQPEQADFVAAQTPVEDVPDMDSSEDEPAADAVDFVPEDFVESEENSDKANLKEMFGKHEIATKKPKPAKTAAAKQRRKKKRANSSVFTGVMIALVIIVVSFVLAVSGIKLGMEYLGLNKSSEDISFYIPAGSSANEIADLLEEKKLISNKTMFKVIVKLKKDGGNLAAGDITLRANMSYSAMIDAITEIRERRDTVEFVIKEGEDLYTIANNLEAAGVCSAEDFLFEFNKNQGYDFESLIETNRDRFYKMEGFCFPDTYQFYLEDSAVNVTMMIRENFDQKFTKKMRERMEEQNLSLDEVMTLASMVQLEAGSDEDMPAIASVFFNRLKNADEYPKLQSDPTKYYARDVIQIAIDPALSYERYHDAYDTYVCEGLPAGPVGNPGLAAINAVLYPDDTDYFYFCANIDTKKTYFAKTLKEHEQNLIKAGLTDQSDDEDEEESE